MGGSWKAYWPRSWGVQLEQSIPDGSYNTVQEYAVLRTYADVIEPDVVVLLYVENDIEPNDPPFDPWSETSLQGKSSGTVIQMLLQKSWHRVPIVVEKEKGVFSRYPKTKITGSWGESDRKGIRLCEKVSKDRGQWKSFSVRIG